MKKKYKLTKETIEINGHILHRIKALREINNVKVNHVIKKGDLGGYVESEDNLSQDGDCWILDDAKVFGNSMILVDARIYNLSTVEDNAQVSDQAQVSFSHICDSARIKEHAIILGNSIIYDYALITDNSIIGNHTFIGRETIVSGDSSIAGKIYHTDRFKNKKEFWKKYNF